MPLMFANSQRQVFSNTFLCLFSNTLLTIRAGIHKLLVRIANWEALIVLLKEFFENVNFEKSQQMTREA